MMDNIDKLREALGHIRSELALFAACCAVSNKANDTFVGTEAKAKEWVAYINDALATLSKPEPPSGIADLRDRLRNSIEALGEGGIGSNVSMSYEFANDLLDALSKPEPAAVGEPVAVIGRDWQLLWASPDSLKAIVERTGVEIGTKLYASPVPSGGADEKAIRHDERKKIIAQGCIHTRKAGENADYDRPDVSQWQHDQSEYFDPTILEIVSEYAAWRDSQPSPSEAISPPDERAVVEALPSIWPLGHGVVMAAAGEDEFAGHLFFTAVPDEMIGKPGQPGNKQDFQSLMSSDAPRMIIRFADEAAIDAHIALCEQARAALKSGASK